MRIDEFLVREINEDRTVIRVGKHKINYAQDDTNLVLTTAENSYFERYSKYMKPMAATIDSQDYFVLNWGGNPITASNVRSGIKQIGIASGVEIFPNIFRNSASTNVFYHFPEMAENIASHMDHVFSMTKKSRWLLN